MTNAYGLDRFGHLIPPAEGCNLCGILACDHAQSWIEGVGWHSYEPPSTELIEARLRTRFAAKETT